MQLLIERGESGVARRRRREQGEQGRDALENTLSTVRAAAIESWSGSNVTDFVAEDGSNTSAVTAGVADIEAMKASMASPSPEVAALMEKHGVVPPITLCIER